MTIMIGARVSAAVNADLWDMPRRRGVVGVEVGEVVGSPVINLEPYVRRGGSERSARQVTVV